MSQRKILTIFIYSILLLFIGRNLTPLPTWQGLSKEKNYSEILKDKTEKIIDGKKGSFSIYYKNLTRDEAFEIDADTIHTAASVNKVPLVIALYTQAEKDKLSLDDQVTIQDVDIQDYGTGVLRYQKPGETYSLRSLAKLALKQSDNTAAHVIKNVVGEDVAQNTIDQIGLTQTSIINNDTSTKDMGILFEKLYTGELLSPANTKEVLSFMKDTDIEDRLPKKLSDATTYHKTGDAVGNIHDVGVIEQDGTTFYLGVMSSDIGGKEEDVKKMTAEIAAEISAYLKEHK